jgi:hypothetical protein
MFEIALVSDKHDDNVGICMIAELLQPPVHVLVCGVLCNVVNKESTNSTSVVADEESQSALCRIEATGYR